MRQHSNEHVNEDDHHAAAVKPKHEFTNELRQVMTLVDSKHVDRREAVDGEVQRLNDLPQAAILTQSFSYL